MTLVCHVRHIATRSLHTLSISTEHATSTQNSNREQSGLESETVDLFMGNFHVKCVQCLPDAISKAVITIKNDNQGRKSVIPDNSCISY
jgi:hypothetical protein